MEELNTSQGGATFVESVFKTVNNRSILDFISEVYIVQMVYMCLMQLYFWIVNPAILPEHVCAQVMERKGINHEQYRKLQNDIDYLFKLVRRNISFFRQVSRLY